MQCGLELNMENARLSIALTRWRGSGIMTASSHSTACMLLGEYLPKHRACFRSQKKLIKSLIRTVQAFIF
jgi:hypothetical protein